MSKFTNVCWCFLFHFGSSALAAERTHVRDFCANKHLRTDLHSHAATLEEHFFFLPTRRSACRNKHYFSLYVTLNVTLEAVSLAFTKTVLTLRPGASVGPLNCWVLTTAQQFMIMLRKLKGRFYRSLAHQLTFRTLSDISKEFLEKLKRLMLGAHTNVHDLVLFMIVFMIAQYSAGVLFIPIIFDICFFFPLMFLILQIKR